MRLVFSLDVEEEGLFSGSYEREPRGLRNVALLRRLEWVTRDFGVPLTLLATWPVFSDPARADLLRGLRDDLGAEIGAHLHPWNTPPFSPEDRGAPSASRLPAPLLARKLETLCEAARACSGVRPVSFRMGRWDFTEAVRDALPGAGIRVDSSVQPLAATPAGTEHFLDWGDPRPLSTKNGVLLEAPLTVVPLSEAVARGVSALRGVLPRAALTAFARLGRVSVQPVWHALPAMKLAANLHARRGGRVLVMFLHSSELLPGANPRLSTQRDVDALLAKIRLFLEWLAREHGLEGRRLGDLATG
ncbi:MAG: hypothetical protein ACEB74_10130 [Desulfovibrio aminophilus]|uniref:hypothetical protein n=1 Tax=Desulfovibrio aminophilus TaxID=81425 RepID=UPI0039E93850